MAWSKSKANGVADVMALFNLYIHHAMHTKNQKTYRKTIMDINTYNNFVYVAATDRWICGIDVSSESFGISMGGLIWSRIHV